MRQGLKYKLAEFFFSLVNKLSSSLIEKEYRNRVISVKSVFYEFLPTVEEKWQGKAIFEMRDANYFSLPSGKLPSYHVVVPEIPLYVVVGNISSADWPTAQRYGISRQEWEAEQADLFYIERATQELATIGLSTKPIVLICRLFMK
jgi:hypothetical protein